MIYYLHIIICLATTNNYKSTIFIILPCLKLKFKNLLSKNHIECASIRLYYHFYPNLPARVQLRFVYCKDIIFVAACKSMVRTFLAEISSFDITRVWDSHFHWLYSFIYQLYNCTKLQNIATIRLKPVYIFFLSVILFVVR